MKDLARNIALKLLLDFEEHHTFLNLALKEGLRSLNDQRDRRFATALVYGVAERKITLDHYISKVSEKKIDSVVRCILRMGIYQMFYMQVPPSAACNTSVDLAKRNGRGHSAGFVNAVLRKCAAEKDRLMLLKKADFSVRYSISPFLVDLLLEQYGKETFVEMMEQGCGKDEAIYLCCNTRKISEEEFLAALKSEGVSLEKAELPHLYRCLSAFSIEDSSCFKKGFFHVIGYHSALAASLVPPHSERVLDLCAAPGGKTFMMASLIKGSIEAFDLHDHRALLLKKGAERLGYKNVCALQMDSTVYNPKLKDCADFVLCDVPCSGLGMMGKKPDIKYKEYDSASLIDTQKKILANGAKYLKAGGRLVYSTCTIDRRENENQVRDFLKNHPDFTLDRDNLIAGEQLFLPDLEGDGFYIAVLKKGNQVEGRS